MKLSQNEYNQLMDLTQKIKNMATQVESLKEMKEHYKELAQERKSLLDDYKKLLQPFQDDYFKGLSTQDIAELAKKSIRLAKDNCELMERIEELESKLN